MTYWNTQQWRRELKRVVPTNGSEECIRTCAYELRLGAEAYVTGGEPGKKTLLERDGDQVVIPPGQFALLLTLESVAIPGDTIGFISVRFTYKVKGLVNVSGFHVDPGYKGKLVFAVYNAGGTEVVLSRGEAVFPIWLASLDEATEDPYKGDRSGSESIRNADIMAIGRTAFAPAALDERLRHVETWLDVTQRIVIAVLIAAALALGGWLVRNLERGNQSTPGPSPTVSMNASLSPP